jgi:hypothetical protein
MKQLLFFSLLILSFTFSAQASSAKKKKALVIPSSPLFTAEDLQRMDSHSRERYMDALRKYVIDNQAQDSAHAFLWLDQILGLSF